MLSNPILILINMSDENYLNIDLHKDIVDEITLTQVKEANEKEKDIMMFGLIQDQCLMPNFIILLRTKI